MPTAKCIRCKKDFRVDDHDMDGITSCPLCGFKFHVWKDAANNIRVDYPDLDIKETMSSRNVGIQGADQ